ncbi:GNAT family N-acetyltransferase [Caloramator proteoclasticus]|uniref:Putative acetyltransferase n=1 Tax=Caloramator proteoclasticus DSM 10124 TaxID=1121262 RepID=A0A1M5AWA4_9CLOT|nr:GNAT family N-acetyltransferase [Caloramator proteoclasticus]SHF34505.1 putative acetyltransferase [Caloramator proteoclasticus DSM 10124]
MDYLIRPIRLEDAEAINEMRRMDGVRETILGIKSERINKTEDFIKGLGANDHILVAEVNNVERKVVGVVGLHINTSLRARHCASVWIMVHKDYQGMGIGKALLKEVLDLADNWLKLVRVELSVFVDNERAINLYKSLGFQIEGTKKYAAIKNGEYADEFIMARYKI